MNTTNLENAVNQLMPNVLKAGMLILVVLGLVMLTVAIIRYVKKDITSKELTKDILIAVGTCLIGLLMKVLIPYVATYEVDYSTPYKLSFPALYFIILFVWAIVASGRGDK